MWRQKRVQKEKQWTEEEKDGASRGHFNILVTVNRTNQSKSTIKIYFREAKLLREQNIFRLNGQSCFETDKIFCVFPLRSIITTSKWSCGRVMFSRALVGYILHQTWGPTPYPPTTLDIRSGDLPLPPLLTSDGHHWRPVQTCSLEALVPPPPSNCYWHLVVATETLMVAKRSASILLECCRVFECKRGQLPKTVNINRSDRKNRGFTVPVAFGSWLVESELRSAQQTLAPAQPRYEAR